MSINVFIYINYGETYRSVSIDGPGNANRLFSTGDAPTDYAAALAYGADLAKRNGVGFMESSSCMHFVWDVPGYMYDENDMIQHKPEAISGND